MTSPRQTFDPVACDREPIHIPGAIQPHGALIVFDPRDERILQVAGDTAALVGVPARDLPGAPLARLGDRLAEQVRSGATELERPLPLGRLETRGGGLPAIDLTLHRSGGALLLEVEPSGPGGDLTRILGSLRRMGDDLEAAPDMGRLLDRAAQQVRGLTGFDRVMIYRFLPDGSGVVSAEACVPGLVSYLHHRFPASDIPAQARALYLRNPIRVIPDVDYVPAPLVPQENPLTGAPLDLSDCSLRSVSPIHLQYLRNMEVGASMSLSIVVDRDLWGLVACHHRGPRQVPPAIRAACTEIARVLNHQVRARDEDLHHRQSARLRAEGETWIAKASEVGLKRSLVEDLEGLRGLLSCDGIAVVSGEAVSLAGRTPDEAGIRRLLPWLLEAGEGTCRATDHLAGIDAGAAACAAAASGALGVVLAKADPVAVLWFRAEQTETIQWAGDPNKHGEPGESGALTPRRSFETWKEIVRQRSRPWTDADREAGVFLARRMVTLYQSEKLDLLNGELERTVAKQNELMAQMDMLVREMNHRVQNNLQTVLALLHLYGEDCEDIEARSRFEEAGNRIMAISRIHQHLWRAKTLGSVDMGQYLADLRKELVAAWGSEWDQAIEVKADSIAVPVAAAVPLALVVTELLTNAVKYAYGGATGPVELRLERLSSDRASLVVRDQGEGMAASVERQSGRQGFGSRLTRAMVSSLGGNLRIVSGDSGTSVHLDLPLESA